MANITKTVHIADEALPIIAAMTWEEKGNGTVVGKLTCGQLERNLYLAVNKGLEALGGKWNRKQEGHVFATDPRPQLQGLLDTGAVKVVKDGYFPTPRAIGERMAILACLHPGMRVLEPSAGTGELAEAILTVEPRAALWVAEKDEQRQQVLRGRGFELLVHGEYDFLTSDVGTWPRIIQNPPFENGQDMEHIRRAHSCLSSAGILVSVISESPFFVDYTQHQAFRDWLRQLPHDVFDLPQDAFKESGSGAKSRIVRIGGR